MDRGVEHHEPKGRDLLGEQPAAQPSGCASDTRQAGEITDQITGIVVTESGEEFVPSLLVAAQKDRLESGASCNAFGHRQTQTGCRARQNEAPPGNVVAHFSRVRLCIDQRENR